MKRAYIFGAHSRGRTTAVYLQNSEEGFTVSAFLIDNDEANLTSIDGITVLDIRTDIALSTDCPVFIGTRGIYHQEIEDRLRKLGFTDIRPVTVSLDTQLRTEYFKKQFAKEGHEFIKIEDISPDSESVKIGNACIYEVRSVYDKPLEKDVYIKREYERPIQVGAALTDIRLPECEIRDDDGENVSDKNRQLCEVTALYWIWKHQCENLMGLVHYRRHFLLPDDWAWRMAGENLDVLLPVPLYLGPSIGENYRFRHMSSDWDVLLDVLDDEDAEKCFAGTMFFPCNMFVMKKDILNDYCSWLFPVLFKVMDRVGTRDDAYQNRYPAFMAERLLNLYCYKHRDRLKIIYADKNFLS